MTIQQDPHEPDQWWFARRFGDCGTYFGLSFDSDCLASTTLQSDNAAFCIAQWSYNDEKVLTAVLIAAFASPALAEQFYIGYDGKLARDVQPQARRQDEPDRHLQFETRRREGHERDEAVQ